MYDFRQVEIEDVIIHGIGNRAKEENIMLSQKMLFLDEAQKSVLLSYYLNPFKTDDYYQFIGEEAASEDTKFTANRLYNHIRQLYKEPDAFVQTSQDIAKFLYELMTNSKIKSGELHVVKFKNCIVGDELVSAIGLFKSETKEPFIKLVPSQDEIAVKREEGISLKKLDRACLIFNLDKENGYKILNVDKNKHDLAVHWQFDFLNIRQRQENYYHTNNFINLVKSFSEEVLNEEHNIQPAEQIAFIQRTEDFFKFSDEFDTDTFKEEVIANDEINSVFDEYIPNFEQDFDIEIQKKFPISKQALKSNKKYFKSVIKLDKSFHVYVHTNPENLEKGYDAARDMKYYKLYFQEEE
ncbi:MAG: nucleoid-associated protein [Bacteroidales bacterium]|nr:nucleoid-associated protein [Bacteroidales bacterium]